MSDLRRGRSASVGRPMNRPGLVRRLSGLAGAVQIAVVVHPFGQGSLRGVFDGGETGGVGQPIAYLLAGLPGSGKTGLSKALADRGVVRLAVDEEVFRLNGRFLVDYPEREYPAREAPVVEAIRRQLIECLHDGQDVVLDHGLWLRSEREMWALTVRAAGGSPVLVYLPVAMPELRRRLAERNHREDANALAVSEKSLDSWAARFEPPDDLEGAVIYTGDVDAVRSRRR
jgi:predicted kinase